MMFLHTFTQDLLKFERKFFIFCISFIFIQLLIKQYCCLCPSYLPYVIKFIKKNVRKCLNKSFLSLNQSVRVGWGATQLNHILKGKQVSLQPHHSHTSLGFNIANSLEVSWKKRRVSLILWVLYCSSNCLLPQKVNYCSVYKKDLRKNSVSFHYQITFSLNFCRL